MKNFAALLLAAMFLTSVVPTRADDALYHAVSDYLLTWKDFQFEAGESVTKGTAQQEPRFAERHAKGVCQKEGAEKRWRYTVTMDEDYKYPLPGEVTAPLNGEFILLPAVTPSGGINERSWQKPPGSARWEKVSATTFTLATRLATDHLFHSTVIDSGLLRSAQPKGTFPVFGAEANRGRKAILYEVTPTRPPGYRFGYWIDAETKQLLQISVAKTEYGENHDMTVGFWAVNQSASPVIVAP